MRQFILADWDGYYDGDGGRTFDADRARVYREGDPLPAGDWESVPVSIDPHVPAEPAAG